MIALLPLLLQAAPPPDIQLGVMVEARSLTIEKKGEARLELRSSPDGGGNVLKVEAPRADSRRTISNPKITIDAEVRIADPAAPPQ